VRDCGGNACRGLRDPSELGRPSHAGCPCFGDQPLIGADTNGFYVSTNEFPISGPGFNGAQIYAMSKSALAAGTLPPVVHIAAVVERLGILWIAAEDGVQKSDRLSVIIMVNNAPPRG
jgi:hypothetical protein